MQDEYWEKYADLKSKKNEQREKKKRKRMPIQGKSVFRILEIKKKRE